MDLDAAIEAGDIGTSSDEDDASDLEGPSDDTEADEDADISGRDSQEGGKHVKRGGSTAAGVSASGDATTAGSGEKAGVVGGIAGNKKRKAAEDPAALLGSVGWGDEEGDDGGVGGSNPGGVSGNFYTLFILCGGVWPFFANDVIVWAFCICACMPMKGSTVNTCIP